MRISVGVEHLILRIPNFILRPSTETSLKWAKSWFEKKISKHPHLLTRFENSPLQNGHRFKLLERAYQLNIVQHTQDRLGCTVTQDEILISRPDNNITSVRSEIALIHLSLAKYFKEEIKTMVGQLNDLYFQEELKRINLKYNRSNWGSCSTKKNINLSTRLLFAPIPVIEYVIIHELAHLKEMNHSKKFWSIVESIDPKFKEKEKWLKVNAHINALHPAVKEHYSLINSKSTEQSTSS